MTETPDNSAETRARNSDDWGREAWRQPTIGADEELLYSEPGRVLRNGPFGGTDCRSHSFAVVKPKFGNYFLLVKHGGGEESVDLGYSKRIVAALEPLDSDTRYWLLHVLLDVRHRAQTETRDRVASEYRRAFVAGTLKKRKMPGRDAVKVWIEPTPARRTAAR